MKIGNSFNHIYTNRIEAVRAGQKNPQKAESKTSQVTVSGSGKNIGTLQKKIHQIQDEIRRIQESDEPEKEKTEQIQFLQQQIEDLKEQEKQSTAQEQQKDPSAEELKEKGFTVVDRSTVNELLSTAGSLRQARTARVQYVAAKGRHDEFAMSKALKFQIAYLNKARQSAESAGAVTDSAKRKKNPEPEAPQDAEFSGNNGAVTAEPAPAAVPSPSREGLSAYEQAGNAPDGKLKFEREA